MSDSSFIPPRDTLAKFLPSALATDTATELLPTPGGPIRQRICHLRSGASCFTAIYSRTLSFTFLSPS